MWISVFDWYVFCVGCFVWYFNWVIGGVIVVGWWCEVSIVRVWRVIGYFVWFWGMFWKSWLVRCGVVLFRIGFWFGRCLLGIDWSLVLELGY